MRVKQATKKKQNKKTPNLQVDLLGYLFGFLFVAANLPVSLYQSTKTYLDYKQVRGVTKNKVALTRYNTQVPQLKQTTLSMYKFSTNLP